MTHVLVTGGAGFIGSHLTDYLIEVMGYSVVVLDDLSGGFRENIHPKASFVQGSVTNHQLVDQLFTEHRFSHVYHLAAYAAEGLSHFIKRFNYENNVIGSINLINASVNHGVRCFVFTSSIAVYGTNQVPMREDMTPEPEDSYGIAKFAVEKELSITNMMFGLPYVIFRPHNVYGERQNIGDKYRNVIGIFMNTIVQKKDLIIFGDGEQRRAFTYVGDIIPAIAKSADQEKTHNQIFNVGSDRHYSLNELAGQVMDSMGEKARVRHTEPRHEVAVAYSDHAKLREHFPNLPVTSLETGLTRMAAWVKKHGAKTSWEFSSIEIEKNMPPLWRLK